MKSLLTRTLFIGIVTCIIAAIFISLLSNGETAIKITGGAGLVSWLLAGLLSGAFISGDRTRANESIETEGDKRFRSKYSSLFFIFGLPWLATALVLYLMSK
ncbi:hypothetical protein DFP94_102198 [Fontibacillus phaseoli]|uniref:DUF5316 domain-containing protein n=1 Tax=Fontibacillus phaseoli TaxID=1416533 RepID=A0A369BJZ3_9BACL|nr:DUF5316 domain-containing protein [Fontibacillus phaseoli]RCX21445.1 hypothetical protein DFP94_102198 [Fontibacillus phaseoli]